MSYFNSNGEDTDIIVFLMTSGVLGLVYLAWRVIHWLFTHVSITFTMAIALLLTGCATTAPRGGLDLRQPLPPSEMSLGEIEDLLTMQSAWHQLKLAELEFQRGLYVPPSIQAPPSARSFGPGAGPWGSPLSLRDLVAFLGGAAAEHYIGFGGGGL